MAGAIARAVRRRYAADVGMAVVEGSEDLGAAGQRRVAASLGKAVDRGKLKLDDPVLSFFPERKIRNRDAAKERITVRHLAGMSSGLDCTSANDEQTLNEMERSDE